jgi:hypothetical protein
MVSYTDGERYQKELQKHIALYQKLGYSLIPINYKDKKPAIEWKPYQTRKPTPEELGAWFDNSIMNIGVVCGNISGQNGTSLVVLDLDNVPDYERFKAVAEKKLGVGNLSDSTLVVRTSRGYHVYFFFIFFLKKRLPVSNDQLLKFKVTVIMSLPLQASILAVGLMNLLIRMSPFLLPLSPYVM